MRYIRQPNTTASPMTPPASRAAVSSSGVSIHAQASGRSSGILPAWIKTGPRNRVPHVRISIVFRPAARRAAQGCFTERAIRGGGTVSAKGKKLLRARNVSLRQQVRQIFGPRRRQALCQTFCRKLGKCSPNSASGRIRSDSVVFWGWIRPCPFDSTKITNRCPAIGSSTDWAEAGSAKYGESRHRASS